MRAHPEPIGYQTPLRSPIAQPRVAPVALFVVREIDRLLYGGEPFTRFYAATSAEALRFMAEHRPRIVVVDWDAPSIDGPEICAMARTSTNVSVLATTAEVPAVPAILKSGCHGILLKPFAPNLLAARMGRIVKETESLWGSRPAPPGWQTGTNRFWSDVACPTCGVRGVTSFDFSSYRRMWYACLSCDGTWLGPRKE